MDGMPNLIGQALLRREDRPLLTGRGQYAGDVCLPDMLHVAVVRAVCPRWRIERVGLAIARAMPGVVGAFALSDLTELRGPLADPAPPGLEGGPGPLLAAARVRYVGEPIAVVVADDAARAVDAVDAAEVEYEALEGVGNVDVAVKEGAPLLHADRRSNIAGRVQRGFGDT